MKKSSSSTSISGVNIAGYVNSEFGLGESVRATIRAVETANIPFVINNCTFNLQRKLDSSYTEFTTDNPYPINIIQLNPDLLINFIKGVNQDYFKNKYNIAFWAWELQELPLEWQQAINIFNEIWLPSSYCVESISAVSPIPVFKVMQNISLPKPLLGRKELDLPEDKFIFLFVFDFCSTFERKNPLATITAFKQAFNKLSENVLLVIKFSNAEHFPSQFKQLQDLVANEPSIKLIDKYLLKGELNALLYNCNCYVSLHRSEGFGFTMAEAMFYEKPVIATGYSANIEYMNVGNSFLVKYDIVTLQEDFGQYKKGNFWADPDIEHAAYLMRYVFDNYEVAKQVGKRAAQEVKALLNPGMIGNKIRKRLELIEELRKDTTILNGRQVKEKQPELHLQLMRSHDEIEQLKTTIAAMGSSKFWKLRSQWFKLKEFLCLSKEN